jgi:hypothetical protein
LHKLFLNSDPFLEAPVNLKYLLDAFTGYNGQTIPLTERGLDYLASCLFGTTSDRIRAHLERRLTRLQVQGLVAVSDDLSLHPTPKLREFANCFDGVNECFGNGIATDRDSHRRRGTSASLLA